MEAALTTQTPCDEAARKEQAFGKTMAGALIGAAVGALLGKVLGDVVAHGKGNQAAKLGALAGAFVGGKLGYDNAVDTSRRQCEVWKTAQLQRTQQGFATLQMGKDVAGEIVATPDDGHFVSGGATLTPKGEAYYRAVARQYTDDAQLKSYEATVRSAAGQSDHEDAAALKNYSANADDARQQRERWGRMRIILTGHTDDRADPRQAREISEQRARNVASLFRDMGVRESVLHYQGAGAAFPVGDNANVQGRQKNNRVEVVVVYSEQALTAYQEARQPDYRLFSAPGGVPADGVAAAPSAATPVPGKSASATVATAPAKSQAKQQKQANGAGKTSPGGDLQTGKIAATAVGEAASAAPGPNYTNQLNFGGMAIDVNAPGVVSKLGRVAAPKLSLATLFGLGTAHADRVPTQSCHMDNPLRYEAGDIKRLAGGESVATRRKSSLAATDAYLGIVQRSYSGVVGKHFVEVRGVTPRATGDLADPLSFHVYEGFAGKSDAEKRAAQPDLNLAPRAISIRGEGGVLVRQFFGKERGLECMDFIIPNQLGQRHVEDAELVYRDANQAKRVRLSLAT